MTQTQDPSEHDMHARLEFLAGDWTFQFDRWQDVSIRRSPASEVEQAEAAIRDALMHVYNG